MERYLGENGSNYSRRTYRVLILLYAFILMAVVGVILQGVEEIMQGQNSAGGNTTTGLQYFAMFLSLFAMCGGLVLFLHWMKRETVCGDRAPRLAAFLAASTNEFVPVPVVAQVIGVEPGKAVGFLAEMQKRKFIRNIEVSEAGDSVRILKFQKIYVFDVYCKNCGAEYSMTSEDDYICQYCGHRVVRKNKEQVQD